MASALDVRGVLHRALHPIVREELAGRVVKGPRIPHVASRHAWGRPESVHRFYPFTKRRGL